MTSTLKFHSHVVFRQATWQSSESEQSLCCVHLLNIPVTCTQLPLSQTTFAKVTLAVAIFWQTLPISDKFWQTVANFPQMKLWRLKNFDFAPIFSQNVFSAPNFAFLDDNFQQENFLTFFQPKNMQPLTLATVL